MKMMLCPNCSYGLKVVELNDQKILHCENCGGSYFEEGAINKITLEQATELAKAKKDPIVSDTPKLCPIDKVPFQRAQDDPTIPPTVALLRCPTCFGIFAFPDDLIKYKKALTVKDEYFKLWSHPIITGKNLAIFVYILMATVTVFALTNLAPQRTTQRPQASEIIKNISTTKSGPYLLMSFNTDIPVQSTVVFSDKTKNKTIEKTLTQIPSTFHFLSTGDVDTTSDVYYQIIIYNAKAEEIGRTKMALLRLGN